MANIQVRIDDNLKQQAQVVTANMGMDVATAIRIFLSQMVKENGLPFRPNIDPFYNPKNQAYLTKVINDMDNKKNIAFHELIEE